MLFGGKRHPAIDNDPLPAPLVAEAVDREVHPDLADAAEACEYQLVLRHGSARPANIEREHIAGRYCGQAALGPLEHEPAGLIKANETTPDFGIAVAHHNRLADAPRMAEPIATDRGEAAAAIPLRQTAAQCGGQAGKQLFRS